MTRYMFMLLLFMFGCANITTITPTGIVEGKVVVAPLCGKASNPNDPNNPCGLTTEEIDGIYKKYSVVITSTETTTSLRKQLNHTGLFSFEVPEGNYTLMIESEVPNALQFSAVSNVQKAVKVRSGEKQTFELRVNTGLP